MQNVDKYRTELLEEFERRKFENKDTDGDCLDIVDVYIDGIEAVKIRHNGGHLKFFSDSFEWLYKLKNGENPIVCCGDEPVWSDGYFISTVGQISETAVHRYIEEQNHGSKRSTRKDN